MSVARPAQRLVGRCLASPSRTRSSTPSAAATARCLQQTFHTSTPRPKRKSQFRNVSATKMGLDTPEGMSRYQAEKFPEYTKEEIAQLREKYTPEQLEALLAGEEAVDPKDMIWQGRLRDDMFMPEYIEDYAKLDPRYDLLPEVEGEAEEPYFPTEAEFERNFRDQMIAVTDKPEKELISRAGIRALYAVQKSKGAMEIDLTEAELDEIADRPELLRKYLINEEEGADGKKKMTEARRQQLDDEYIDVFEKELSKLEGRPQKIDDVEFSKLAPDGLEHKGSVEQPDLGKIPGVEGMYNIDKANDAKDSDGKLEAMCLATGMSAQEIKSLYIKVLVVRIVSNQTRLGKVRSYSVMTIAGNGDGRLGLGMGKSTDMEPAQLAAQGMAIRSMKPIRRYENRTIFGKVKSKISGTVVEVESKPPGFGLRVPSRIFDMCRAVGIYDLATHFPRSKSPMNTVKAMYKALVEQPDPEQIAIGRGKKLVDVRKVYYGGASS